MPTVKQRAIAELSRAGAAGLTIDGWASAARTSRERLRVLLPAIRADLADRGIIIPRPVPPAYRYRGVHGDEALALGGEEVTVSDLVSRLASVVRDAEAMRDALAGAGNASAGRWWRDFRRQAEYLYGELESRLDAIVVRIPGGAGATSKGGKRSTGKGAGRP